MRVLHLTTHLNSGGITSYILRLAEPLRALGVATFVLSSGGTCEPLYRDRDVGLFRISIRTKSELDPRIYGALPALLRIIKENRIDLLHAHTRVTQVLAGWARRFSGIPVVTTCHGFYRVRIGRRLNPSWGDYAIAISAPVAQHLIQDHRVPAERVTTVLNGVDFHGLEKSYARHDPLQRKRAYGFSEKDPVLGIVARLVEDKGHRYLIQAMPALIKKYPSIRLLVVGDGKYRVPLEHLVSELKIVRHVVFTGALADVTEALAAMDLFVFPATWREGFGLSIGEAMGCGKPVIVSNIWALNDLIEDGKTGILIPPKEADAIVRSVCQMLEDHAMRIRIAKAAKETALRLFSLTRMVREIQGLYQKTLLDKKKISI
ncbi:MAG: glycosyltransferase family 4 protein [Candidatus Omnitrophota bacterium]